MKKFPLVSFELNYLSSIPVQFLTIKFVPSDGSEGY